MVLYWNCIVISGLLSRIVISYSSTQAFFVLKTLYYRIYAFLDICDNFCLTEKQAFMHSIRCLSVTAIVSCATDIICEMVVLWLYASHKKNILYSHEVFGNCDVKHKVICLQMANWWYTCRVISFFYKYCMHKLNQ